MHVPSLSASRRPPSTASSLMVACSGSGRACHRVRTIWHRADPTHCEPHRRRPRRCCCACNARADLGAFLDITLDFLIYAAVPLGFAAWSPHANALPAAFLLASFDVNGSAFLAFSIMAERRGLVTTRQGHKSIYYPAGVTEGFETIAFMAALCLFPRELPVLATIFGILCWVSAASRLSWMETPGRRRFAASRSPS
jgi:hypothetical protein